MRRLPQALSSSSMPRSSRLPRLHERRSPRTCGAQASRHSTQCCPCRVIASACAHHRVEALQVQQLVARHADRSRYGCRPVIEYFEARTFAAANIAARVRRPVAHPFPRQKDLMARHARRAIERPLRSAPLTVRPQRLHVILVGRRHARSPARLQTVLQASQRLFAATAPRLCLARLQAVSEGLQPEKVR